MDEIAPWEQFIRSTALHQFVYLHEPWLWPTCEIIHYLGLSLLLGTVGVFDLRVLGMAKNIPPRTIHRLVPWGIGGYFLNVVTGILFFSGLPDQYFYNNAGRLKALLMAVAGLNIVVGADAPGAHQGHRRRFARNVGRRADLWPDANMVSAVVFPLSS
jgi:hypothetical protein